MTSLEMVRKHEGWQCYEGSKSTNVVSFLCYMIHENYIVMSHVCASHGCIFLNWTPIFLVIVGKVVVKTKHQKDNIILL